MTTGRRRDRKTYADTVADVRTRLFGHLRQQVGPATDDYLTGLLKAASAWSPQGARVLDEHLKLHPDAFSAPDRTVRGSSPVWRRVCMLQVIPL